MTEISPGRLYKLAQARKILSCGNTKIWQLIGNGDPECRKMGRVAVVPGQSLLDFIERLPRHQPRNAA